MKTSYLPVERRKIFARDQPGVGGRGIFSEIPFNADDTPPRPVHKTGNGFLSGLGPAKRSCTIIASVSFDLQANPCLPFH